VGWGGEWGGTEKEARDSNKGRKSIGEGTSKGKNKNYYCYLTDNNLFTIIIRTI
jgi:hypothetical protein